MLCTLLEFDSAAAGAVSTISLLFPSTIVSRPATEVEAVFFRNRFFPKPSQRRASATAMSMSQGRVSSIEALPAVRSSRTTGPKPGRPASRISIAMLRLELLFRWLAALSRGNKNLLNKKAVAGSTRIRMTRTRTGKAIFYVPSWLKLVAKEVVRHQIQPFLFSSHSLKILYSDGLFCQAHGPDSHWTINRWDPVGPGPNQRLEKVFRRCLFQATIRL